MSYEMRPSRVLTKLRAGKLATCIKLNLADPRVVEIAALCDIDCVWVDQEHVGNSITVIENQVRAAKAYGCDTLVRVPRGSYSDLVRPLEMDAAGILVPHLLSSEEAREIAHQTKFHPVGRRALDGGNADGAFTMTDMSSYLQQANEERFVAVQIEDPEAIEHLDAIAATPGIDMLFFGPGDFSQGIGHPGEGNHPQVNEARRLVAEAAIKHGKWAGTVASPASLADTFAMGYRFISMGADVFGLAQFFKQVVENFNQINGDEPTTSATNPSIYSTDS